MEVALLTYFVVLKNNSSVFFNRNLCIYTDCDIKLWNTGFFFRDGRLVIQTNGILILFGYFWFCDVILKMGTLMLNL